jgi:hypothetical protein
MEGSKWKVSLCIKTSEIYDILRFIGKLKGINLIFLLETSFDFSTRLVLTPDSTKSNHNKKVYIISYTYLILSNFAWQF